MERAHGRTFSYVRSDMGATSPGRWQFMHLSCMSGAMSSVHVGVCAYAWPALIATTAITIATTLLMNLLLWLPARSIPIRRHRLGLRLVFCGAAASRLRL